MAFRAQGAIRSSSGTTYRAMLAQGATEYLVLLAVVLIVALVSVALLGFFPRMAGDAQETQSQMYWKGASPVSLEDFAPYYSTVWQATLFSLVVKNNGAYPVRITKLVGGSGGSTSSAFICHGTSTGFCPVYNGGYNISDYYYLAPGEKKIFDYNGMIDLYVDNGGSASTWHLYAAKTVCQNSTSSPGMAQVDKFGFEYIEYVDGQQITKRQIGKPLVAKCLPAGA